MGFSRQEYWSGLTLPSPMEYYSAIKKNEIMSFTTTWKDLEIVMLNEVSQAKKEKYFMAPLTCGI